MIVTILMAALVAVSPTGLVGGGGPSWGGGGPDSFGYRWLDSDTTAPGAPTYNWVNIKGVGTRITSLGDDNYAGPFLIGFQFPYYWYKVDRLYVGSNGYITFTTGGLNASPFPRVPAPTLTNNTVAPMMSDIDCSPGGSPNGSVWYWANADTFIVEYDSVRFWSTGGNNTFQIILSRPDSSITFQYKEQSGAPYNGWVPDANQCGIENVSGRIGLNYLNGNLPPGNMYHAELAVRFIPPDSTSYQVHDVGMRNAMNDRSGGMFAVNNRPLKLWSVVQNFGNQPEGAFKTYFRVLRANGSTAYSDSATAGATQPGQTDSLNFPDWVPTATGVYTIKTWTRLAGDAFAGNDSAIIELRVVNVPATLTYDGGVAQNFMSWNGPGGFGNRFVPPVYPCTVTSARIYMQSTGSTPCAIAILDDNGPGGTPGDTFYVQTVTVTTANWYTVTPSSPVVITDGAFFVGGMSEVSSLPQFGMDSTPPLSRQGWEYTGVWAPSRDASLRDVMANANVSGLVGVEEWLEPTPMPVPVRIDVRPSVVNTTAKLRLVNPRGTEQAIEVYDATGGLVRTLSIVRNEALLDARELAGGIYFARVAGSDSPVAKVLIGR